MKRIIKKLDTLWLLCIPVLILMILCSEIIFQWWIGNSVSVPFSLSVCIAVYVFLQTGGNIYMYLINGTSKVRIQLIVYLLFALTAIPLMTFLRNVLEWKVF